MEFISVFDVIGPNMIGPSSSHTAGAVSIALMARHMLRQQIVKVTFTLYGSFAKTYRGHGTDKALLGGILGFATDDIRIRDAFEIAEKQGLDYQYIIDSKTKVKHPNTVDILLVGADGDHLLVRGESIGGGKIRISEIDHIEVDFTGEYSTLIVKHYDRPGLVVHITQCLSRHNVNIAFMRMFREERGGRAFAIIESDEKIPPEIVSEMYLNPFIDDIMLIQV
jgi:L-serine dehydratase